MDLSHISATSLNLRCESVGFVYRPRRTSSSMAALNASASVSLANDLECCRCVVPSTVYQRHRHRMPCPYRDDRHRSGTCARIGSLTAASDRLAVEEGGTPLSFFNQRSSIHTLAMPSRYRRVKRCRSGYDGDTMEQCHRSEIDIAKRVGSSSVHAADPFGNRSGVYAAISACRGSAAPRPWRPHGAWNRSASADQSPCAARSPRRWHAHAVRSAPSAGGRWTAPPS